MCKSPVLIWDSKILMLEVLVTWIPSVLGLASGASTTSFEASTSLQSWKFTCICCALRSLKLLSVRFEQFLKVKACIRIQKQNINWIFFFQLQILRNSKGFSRNLLLVHFGFDKATKVTNNTNIVNIITQQKKPCK